ncbi:hypothetical protein [Ornithinibacillus xuwenensis]|uniref:Uncharacterized protein n=1 Tax=Ornithinibacillus xuwenensis TaxID=3144668 RepID=A0ABU9XN93_9BACI
MIVESVMTIGSVLAVLVILFGFIFIKVGTKTYLPYFPSVFLFVAGVMLLMITTVADKTELFGAGLGGWGIACLFAAVIGFLVTSVSHALKLHD